MEPYYHDDVVTLYHGDSREALAQMPDRSVACAITDPPYSENTHTRAKTNRSLRGKDVNVMDFGHVTLDDLDTAFVHMGRISSSWVISNLDYKHAFHFDWQPPEGLRMLRIGVWVKPNPMPQISGDRPGQGWEAIAFMAPRRRQARLERRRTLRRVDSSSPAEQWASDDEAPVNGPRLGAPVYQAGRHNT